MRDRTTTRMMFMEVLLWGEMEYVKPPASLKALNGGLSPAESRDSIF
jgi:hypothetical protein